MRQLFLPVDLLLKTLLSCTGPIAGDVLLSVIVIGELLYGFRRGSLIERNVAELRSFLDNPYVSLVTVGPRNRGPLLTHSDFTESEGAAHPNERYLDCGSSDGNRCRSCIGGQAL